MKCTPGPSALCTPAPCADLAQAAAQEGSDVYENQRKYPLKGWSSKLLPTDRGRFSSEDGKVCANGQGAVRRDALGGKGPQRRPQQRLDRRLEEVAKAVGGGYCRLQMPLRLALGVRGTVAGRRLGALEEGGGG